MTDGTKKKFYSYRMMTIEQWSSNVFFINNIHCFGLIKMTIAILQIQNFAV